MLSNLTSQLIKKTPDLTLKMVKKNIRARFLGTLVILKIEHTALSKDLELLC